MALLMARTVRQEEYIAKRNEILDSAQRLVFRKGYEKMTIQDILRELGMSNGAFFHYFDSKAALLEAYIERGQDDLDKIFRAIVEDPSLSALDKFQRFFATLDRMRRTQQAFLADLIRVWFADENAIVREKADEVIVRRRAPLLNAIVRQGVQEGVFTTPYPDQAGQVILSITRGMGNVVLKRMLAFEQEGDALHYIEDIVAASAAMAEAIERVLGSSVPILDRPDAQAVKGWMVALSRDAEHTT
jgi:AcrR family transcriptional regulator